MTQQQVFDKVCDHFAKQGHKCMADIRNSQIYNGDNEACAYRARGSNGEVARCAIGAVLPDKYYRVAMEGLPISVLVSDTRFTLPKWMDNDDMVGLLDDLQAAHDNTKGGAKVLRTELNRIARKYNLNASKVSSIRHWTQKMPFKPKLIVK